MNENGLDEDFGLVAGEEEGFEFGLEGEADFRQIGYRDWVNYPRIVGEWAVRAYWMSPRNH